MNDAFTNYMLQEMFEEEPKHHFLDNILPKELGFIFAPTLKDVYTIMAKHKYAPEDFITSKELEIKLNNIISNLIM